MSQSWNVVVASIDCLYRYSLNYYISPICLWVFITTCGSKQYGFHLVHHTKKAHAFTGIGTRVSSTTILIWRLRPLGYGSRLRYQSSLFGHLYRSDSVMFTGLIRSCLQVWFGHVYRSDSVMFTVLIWSSFFGLIRSSFFGHLNSPRLLLLMSWKIKQCGTVEKFCQPSAFLIKSKIFQKHLKPSPSSK